MHLACIALPLPHKEPIIVTQEPFVFTNRAFIVRKSCLWEEPIIVGEEPFMERGAEEVHPACAALPLPQ